MPSASLVVGFDLDMTLVDSADGVTATFISALRESPGGEGVRVDRSDVWPWVGLPLEAMISALSPATDGAQVARTYRSHYATVGVPLTRLLPGALEAFAAVRAEGGRVLVVSAKAEAGVRDVLNAVGLNDPGTAPDLIVGGLFAAAKGDRLLQEAATIYVGDHTGDVQAARVAGAISVAVATGPQPVSALAAAGADVILDDLLGFPQWLSTHVAGFRRSRVVN
jgi:phosphoglycolate phosphatase